MAISHTSTEQRDKGYDFKRKTTIFFCRSVEFLSVVKFTTQKILTFFSYTTLFLINYFMKKDWHGEKKNGKTWENRAEIWLAEEKKTRRKCDKERTKSSILNKGRQIIVEGREIKSRWGEKKIFLTSMQRHFWSCIQYKWLQREQPIFSRCTHFQYCFCMVVFISTEPDRLW